MRIVTSRRAVRCLALAFLFGAGGCAPKGWAVVRGPGPESVERAVARRKPVRLELVGGQVVVLHRARVTGDSVVGTDARQAVGRRRAAFALAEVRTAEQRASIYAQQSRTALLVTLMFLSLMILGS